MMTRKGAKEKAEKEEKQLKEESAGSVQNPIIID